MQGNHTQSPTPGAQLVRSADIVTNNRDEQIKNDQRPNSSMKINKFVKIQMYGYILLVWQPD